MITLEHFLVLAVLVFFTGLLGMFLGKGSFISFLVSLELLLLGTVINLASFGAFYNQVDAQILVLFVLGVGAAEAAVGLIILLFFFREKGSISAKDMSQLREID